MKTAKFNYLMALLLIVAVLAPVIAYGGPRDAAVSRPFDDQPWGGEIDNRDYKTGSISSIGHDPYPSYVPSTTIRNIGTPLVLIDYIRFFIFDYTAVTENFSTISQVNITTVPDSETSTSSPINNKRFLIRKGR